MDGWQCFFFVKPTPTSGASGQVVSTLTVVFACEPSVAGTVTESCDAAKRLIRAAVTDPATAGGSEKICCGSAPSRCVPGQIPQHTQHTAGRT
jgi:hypothetical protein